MDTRKLVSLSLTLTAITIALTGCGGGSTGTSATPLVGADSLLTKSTVSSSPDASPPPAVTPVPNPSPSACPSPGPGHDPGVPGTPDHPLRGAVKSVDAAALQFVLTPPPGKGGEDPNDGEHPNRGEHPPAPSALTVTTDATTVFVFSHSRDTSDPAKFTDLAPRIQVLVVGTVSADGATIAATRVVILVIPPVPPSTP